MFYEIFQTIILFFLFFWDAFICKQNAQHSKEQKIELLDFMVSDFEDFQNI